MDITEAQLGWIMGCLLLLGLVLGYPSIMTALAFLVFIRSARSLSQTLKREDDDLRELEECAEALRRSELH